MLLLTVTVCAMTMADIIIYVRRADELKDLLNINSPIRLWERKSRQRTYQEGLPSKVIFCFHLTSAPGTS